MKDIGKEIDSILSKVPDLDSKPLQIWTELDLKIARIYYKLLLAEYKNDVNQMTAIVKSTHILSEYAREYLIKAIKELSE